MPGPLPRSPPCPARAATCVHDTATGGGPPRPRARRPYLRVRHHAVRRDPHRPRGDLHTRSTSFSAPGSTPATRFTTSRTSPTSTIRCSSGPTRDGVDWRDLAEREIAPLPRGHDGAADAAAAALHRRRRGHPGHRRRSSSGCGTRAPRTNSRATSTSPCESDPHFGEVSHLDADAMRLLSAERGGDPDRPGKKNPLDSDALAGRPRRRAVVGRRLARRRPARLAHRVRGHRPGPPRHGLRRAGRRLRPRLPAPRDGRLARAGADRRVAVRATRTCTPAWSPCDGEKMSKSQGNLVFVSAAAPGRASTRRRSGWRCSPTTTAATGSGPTPTSTAAEARLGRWREAVARPDGPPAEPVLDGIRRHQADDLDAPGSLQVVRPLGHRRAHPRRFRRGRTRAGRERRRRDPRHPPLDRRDPHPHRARFPVGPGVVGHGNQLDLWTELGRRVGTAVGPPSGRGATGAQLTSGAEHDHAAEQVRPLVDRYRFGRVEDDIVKAEAGGLVDALQAVDQRAALEGHRATSRVDSEGLPSRRGPPCPAPASRRRRGASRG